MILGQIAAVLLAAPAPASQPVPVPVAPDARWSPVGSEFGIAFFLDESRLAATGEVRRARVRLEGAIHQPVGARSAVGTVEVDCRNRTGRPVEFSYFDARGALIETRSTPPERVRVRARPGSVDAQLQARVCGRGAAAPAS